MPAPPRLQPSARSPTVWEEEHPPIGFRNPNESIIFAQFAILGLASSWILGTEHTMAITMLTVLGVLTLILFFNHLHLGLFDSRRSVRRFWLLLLPVAYSIGVYAAGVFWPVLRTVVLGNESFMVLQQQPVLAPVSTIAALGWPSLAFGCGAFIAAIGLLCLVQGTFLFWRLLWLLALSAVALSVFGWLLWLIGIERIYFFITPPQETFFASFTHPHYWAVFALAWATVLGGLMLQKKAGRNWGDFFADKGLLLIIGFFLLLASVIPTGAPAHQIAAVAVLAFFFAQIAIEQWQKNGRASSLLFWVLTLGLVALCVQRLLSATLGQQEALAPLGISLLEQRNLWQDAWGLFLQRPLLGWGEGGFAAMHPFFQSTDLQALRYSTPSSDLLLALADKGLLGTLVTCAIPTGVLIAFMRLKKRKDLSFCMLFAVAIILVFALVSNPLQSPPVLITFYLLLIGAYQWSKLDVEAQTPVARRTIQPEGHLRNTPNSRKQKTRVSLPATPLKAGVPQRPSISSAAGQQQSHAQGLAAAASHSQLAAGTAATVTTAGTAATEPAADANFDLIVIGGGSAGYAAASLAQRSGQRVAIIDSGAELGGLCILRGCMPSKTLIYSAEVLHLARHGALFGLDIPQAGVDMKALHERKKRVIGEFADYRREQLESGRFTLYRQKAHFSSPRSVTLEDGTTLAAAKFLIATGSRVSVPAVPGLAQTPCWTSDDVLDLDFVPRSVIVLGGGIVACELAQFLCRIGTKVTLIQRSARVLKEQSAEASAVVEAAFTSEGMEVITGTTLESVQTLPEGGVKVTFTHGGQWQERRAEHLFNALGRSPNTDGLNLETAGVQTRSSGHIAVNAFQQTTNPDIYAAGDVAGPHEIVHVAILQAEVAAQHAFGQKASPVDTAALTGVVFTSPQIAHVGPSEADLQARGIQTISASYPFDDHGKSILMEAKRGYVKTVVNKADGRLLAAECVGPDASELIHAMAVAITLKARAKDLLAAHWYHPTLSEIWTYPLEECAEAVEHKA